MYNKHTNKKTDYTAIIENTLSVTFNTSKKREDFIARLKGTRTVTRKTDTSYPWNAEDGIHNLVSPRKFAEHTNIADVSRIERAIRKGKLQSEALGAEEYVVVKNGFFRMNGLMYRLE